MKKLFKWLRRYSCQHKFDHEDLIGRKTPDGNVIWPCWKCGKVFEEHCGLYVLRNGGYEPKNKKKLLTEN